MFLEAPAIGRWWCAREKKTFSIECSHFRARDIHSPRGGGAVDELKIEFQRGGFMGLRTYMGKLSMFFKVGDFVRR